jgi:hypothetical protein
MLTTEIELQNVREYFRVVRQIEPDLIKELRSNLKTSLKPTANEIANSIPDVNNSMSGFRNNKTGRTRYTNKVRSSVSLTPASIRKGESVHPLVSLTFAPPSNAVGFSILETIGTERAKPRDRSRAFTHWRSGSEVRYRYNGQGYYLIKRVRELYPIRGKAGRFVFDEYLKKRDDITRIATAEVEKFIDTVNGKLNG